MSAAEAEDDLEDEPLPADDLLEGTRMQLIVVRHAIAAERDPEAWPDDGLRPLTPRGRKRFKRAAAGLKRLVPEVDILLSSPHTRAWDTALILHQRAGWPLPQVCDELRDSPPADVIRVLRLYAHLKRVAIVGHEPYLGRLLCNLLSPHQDASLELRKGAAACLDLPEPGSSTPAQLHWLIQPRALRLMA